MRRALVIGIITLVFLCCGRQDVDAVGPDSNMTVSERLSQEVSPNTYPQISVTPNGQVWLAWIVDGQVLVATPDTPLRTAFIPRYADQPADLTLTTSQGQYVAWSETVSGTHYILWQPLDARQPAESHSLAFPISPTFGIDRFGRIHAAWALSDTLHYLTGSPAVSQTIPLSASASDLMLSMDNTGTAYLVWAQTSSISANTGIYFQRLEPDSIPIRIAPQGIRPQVRVDSGGRIHIAYIVSNTLYYANSDNWLQATSLATGLADSVPFALAIGPDDIAHLIWVQDDVLGYANAGDWTYSYRSYNLGNPVNSVALALDSAGNADIVYASINETGLQDVYYVKLATPIFQLAITTPLGGDIISQPFQVEAISNLPPSSILRVDFYLESEELDQAGIRTLIPLGSDSDGSDGWSAEVRPVDILVHRYRLCALATANDGRQTEACSESFTLLPTGWPDIWLTTPISNMGVNPIIFALVSPITSATKLDLWAQPMACTEESPNCPSAGRIRYLGRIDVMNTSSANPFRQRLAFNTDNLPEGIYLFSAAPVLDTGIFTNTLQVPVKINDIEPPRVTVLPTTTSLMVSDTLEVSATVEAGQAAVTHVDYYLVRSQPLLAATSTDSDTLSSQRELWLGSATSADNWRVRVSLGSSWLGEEWRIKAIAYDEDGLYSSAYATTTLSVLDPLSPRPFFTFPSQDQVLQGTVMIQVMLQPAITTTGIVHLMVQNEYGDLVSLGDLSEENGMWSFPWDTYTWQNGRYSLIAIADSADGRQVKTVCAGLIVANTSTSYIFSSPLAGEDISGTVTFIVTPTANTSETLPVRFTIQAPDKRVWDLGSAALVDGAYGLAWNSLSALDGPYTVTAIVDELSGQQVSLEKRINVNNATPTIVFQGTTFTKAWNGNEDICWKSSDPLNKLVVLLEYSPDDGIHWVEIARNLGASGCFNWDTHSAPDASACRLRLTATNGSYSTRLVSEPFIVDNIAEQPILTLIAPLTGTTLGRQTRIAWQGWNPDAGGLRVDIAYRLENRDWITMASGLSATGEFIWNTTKLNAKSCDLRVAARAPSGRLELVTAANLSINPVEAPIVRLFSPKGGETLTNDGLILWNVPDVISNQITVDLYYSDNAGQTWLPLAEGLENTGYYQWQVSFLPAGNQYRVRIVAHTKEQTFSADSPNTFSIGTKGTLQVSLLQPIPGSDLIGQQFVSWYVADDNTTRLASIDIRPLGETVWRPLVRQIQDNGFYIWDTTRWADGLYELRLAIYSDQITTTTQLNGVINLSNRRNHPPEAQLLEPKAGESLDGLVPVRWQASDRDGDSLTATLSMNRVGSEEWQTITHLAANEDYYLWDTHAITLSGEYHLRLEVSDGQSYVTSELSEPVMLLNKLNEPGHLDLTADSASIVETGQITWLAQDGLGNALGANVSLSDDNGRSWHTLADNMIENNSTYLDPLELEPGLGYALRLNTSSGQIREELPIISILKPLLPYQEPQLEIQAPGSGITWTQTQEVLWLTDDPLGRMLKISVDLSADGGLTWDSLAHDAEAIGTFLWDTTQSENGDYMLRITADNLRVRLERTTGPFSLVNSGRDRPIISLLYPLAGEVWSGTRLVRWRTLDPDGRATQVSLAFSTDNGISWQPIAIAIPDEGSYVLDTNILPNCTRVWLRATVTDGFFVNQDLTDGPITILNPRNPIIKLLTPTGGQIGQLFQPISWVATTTSARLIEVELAYSINNGVTWLPIAEQLPASGSYLWNTGSIPSGSNILLRVLASDGQGTAVDTLTSPVVLPEITASPLPFFRP